MADQRSGRGRKQRLSHYDLLEVIGAGGMGTVYRAIDRRSKVVVAVKTVHPHLQESAAFVERFRREAHIASLLGSPYVVRILDFGSERGQYFMVTEFVEGQKLSDIMRAGPMPPVHALAIAVQVALALDEAEGRGVVHRDIKPDNIIITPDNAVKVLDFGIARLNTVAGVTTTGLFIGTMTYASPEQFLGHADTRSDIYSLGVTLFHMLAGQPPFHAATPTGVMRMHEDTPPPLELLKGVPQQLVAVIERCMQKSPDARYQHVSEFLAACEVVRRSMSEAKTDSWMSDATSVLRISAADGGATEIAAADDATRLAGGGGASAAQTSADATRLAASHAPVAPARTELLPSSGGGAPPRSSYPPTTGGRADDHRTLFAVVGAAAAVVIAVLVGLILHFSHDGGSKSVVAADRTSTAAASVSRTATRGTPTPSGTAAADASSTSVVATQIASAPPNSIAEGQWDIRFISKFNDCGFGLAVNDISNTSFTLTWVTTDPSDGFITSGDTVNIVESGGNLVADQTFSYPTFTFSWARVNIGPENHVVSSNIVTNFKFLNSNRATVSQNEFYGVDSNGDGIGDVSCRISYEDADANG